MKFLKSTGREKPVSEHPSAVVPRKEGERKGEGERARVQTSPHAFFLLCPEHVEAEPPASQAKEGRSSGSSNWPEEFPACMLALSRSVVSDPCDSIHCSLPGSSVHGILQARIPEGVAISFSRGSS